MLSKNCLITPQPCDACSASLHQLLGSHWASPSGEVEREPRLRASTSGGMLVTCGFTATRENTGVYCNGS